MQNQEILPIGTKISPVSLSILQFVLSICFCCFTCFAKVVNLVQHAKKKHIHFTTWYLYCTCNVNTFCFWQEKSLARTFRCKFVLLFCCKVALKNLGKISPYNFFHCVAKWGFQFARGSFQFVQLGKMIDLHPRNSKTR